MADLILLAHFAIVLFIAGGLLVIWLGIALRWGWIRNRAFRMTHLAAMAVVTAQSLLGVICPLTIWENALRENSGESGYSGSFMQHWVHRVMYYDAPLWVFTLIYVTALGLIVLAWKVAPPTARRRHP